MTQPSDTTKQSTSKAIIEEWLKKIEQLYKDEDSAKDFAEEKPFLELYLAKLIEEINDQPHCMYRITEPLFMGGTAIILKASHKNIPNRELAVKINRPLTPQKLPVVDGKPLASVENERHILPLFEHASIIQIIDSGSFEISIENDNRPLSYIVEPLIPNPPSSSKPLNLKQYVDEILTLKETEIVDPQALDKELDESLRCLVDLLHQWVSAVAYIHSKKFLYLDLKPDNALVYGTKGDEHVIAIDFGSTAKIEDSNAPLDIFVTDKYAHPFLKEGKLKRRTNDNRVKCSLSRKEIRPSFDFYALGKSILDLLDLFLQKDSHPHDFPQRPLFRSLHFLATRLLDGQNSERKNTEKESEDAEKEPDKAETKIVLGEVFGELETEDYEDILYTSLDDVLMDLSKELGSWNPEDRVPELSTFSKDMVKIDPNINTAMTRRLRSIMEHPLVARLKAVSQLGLVSLVYPTANHSI
jgi:serine/threonine protein kinase